ncbi:MAG: chain-length determining protein, partial [Clostridiales bacterium]|nr:chain-length determining protein [Clostridiales bacterium]
NLQYNDILLNQKLVKTYSEVVKSNRVLEKVIDEMSLDLSGSSLREKIKVNSVSDTEIIRIAVDDKNPIFAADLANAVAVVFIDEIGSIMKMDNVQFIDNAKVPKTPIKPRPMMNMGIAGLLGLMVSVFIIFLIEYLDNTIKDPKDIETVLELPVLGGIPAFNDK